MIRTFLTLFSITLLFTACSRPSYINIPNNGSDAAINGPNWVTTVQIEKAALRYLLTKDPIPGDIVLLLPKGTNERTAFDIAADLSEFNVFPNVQAPSDEYRVIEVRSVIARGGRGRVDVIRPGTIRERELIEVHMEWSVVDGWRAEYLRVRNIDVGRIDPLRLAAPITQPEAEEVEPEPAIDSAPIGDAADKAAADAAKADRDAGE